MHCLVVYFSKFGHTQRIAETIAEQLNSESSVRVLSVDQMDARVLEAADLVVMGTPTHRMNLPEAVRSLFDQLPRRILRGKLVAAFDTSYKMSPFLSRFTAAKKLARKLRKLGGKRIVPPETFHVEGREGPLFEGEIERARAWVGSILRQVERRSA